MSRPAVAVSRSLHVMLRRHYGLPPRELDASRPDTARPRLTLAILLFVMRTNPWFFTGVTEGPQGKIPPLAPFRSASVGCCSLEWNAEVMTFNRWKAAKVACPFKVANTSLRTTTAFVRFALQRCRHFPLWRVPRRIPATEPCGDIAAGDSLVQRFKRLSENSPYHCIQGSRRIASVLRHGLGQISHRKSRAFCLQPLSPDKEV